MGKRKEQKKEKKREKKVNGEEKTCGDTTKWGLKEVGGVTSRWKVYPVLVLVSIFVSAFFFSIKYVLTNKQPTRVCCAAC